MFDLQRTVELMKGMIVEPRPTWESYFPESGDLQRTLGVLTLPGLLGSAILHWICSVLFSSFYLLGAPGLGVILFTVVLMAIMIALNSFLLAFLAGVFKGQNDFPRALAAFSLASVPSWLGWILSALPFFGLLIALVLTIYSIVLLYKMIPLYLKVPQSARVGHFIATIITSLVVWVLVMLLFGGSMMASMQG